MVRIRRLADPFAFFPLTDVHDEIIPLQYWDIRMTGLAFQGARRFVDLKGSGFGVLSAQ